MLSLFTKVIWLPAGTVTFLGLTPLDVIVITTFDAVLPVAGDGCDGALLVPDPPHAGTTSRTAVSA